MQVLNLLTIEQLNHLYELLENIEFQDGKISARGLAKKVKQNNEAVSQGENYKKLLDYIKHALIENDWIKRRYLPKTFSTPLINKYSINDYYGKHFDASHMTNKQVSIRKDYSFTLMLSKFSDYEGGELVIEDGNKEHKVKLDAGDMVIYPSIHIHNVLPVTGGERIAYVGWFASHVKNPLSLEALNAYEDMHISMLKYDLSDEDKLLLSYVQNRLQHLLSD
tara:strand:- start:537 stop:1202 length:666 start_codon:yes stop_codon:yes gene_type:complete